MSQRVLLLGANGFIGKQLLSCLEKNYDVLELDRKSGTFDIELAQSNPDVVINCSASSPDAGFFESINANILFQMNCLKTISKAKTSSFKWVQVGSYFELQIVHGRKDHYSVHKALCRKLLLEAATDGLIDLTTIFLPHIYGVGEKSSRIIPYLKSQFQKSEVASISSGGQYLPILSLDDAVTAIRAAIHSNQIECSATPVWHGKVIELANSIQEQMGSGFLTSDSMNISKDATFPPTSFPPQVEDWEPKVQFTDFLKSLTAREVL